MNILSLAYFALPHKLQSMETSTNLQRGLNCANLEHQRWFHDRNYFPIYVCASDFRTFFPLSRLLTARSDQHSTNTNTNTEPNEPNDEQVGNDRLASDDTFPSFLMLLSRIGIVDLFQLSSATEAAK